MDLETLKQNSKNRIILMYHDVYETNPNESGFCSSGANFYKIPRNIFERQIRYLSGSTRRSNIYLTFDDGGCSMHTIVAPILEKYGFEGIFCITYNKIGTPGFLSMDQITDLHNRGHIICSHSYSHPQNLTKLNDSEHRHEWSCSLSGLRDIYHMGNSCVAIPNGFYNSIDIEEVRKFGVEIVFNSKPIFYSLQDGVHILGRIAVSSKTTLCTFRLMVRSSAFRHLLNIKQELLDELKRALGYQNYLKIKRVFRRR